MFCDIRIRNREQYIDLLYLYSTLYLVHTMMAPCSLQRNVTRTEM